MTMTLFTDIRWPSLKSQTFCATSAATQTNKKLIVSVAIRIRYFQIVRFEKFLPLKLNPGRYT